MSTNLHVVGEPKSCSSSEAFNPPPAPRGSFESLYEVGSELGRGNYGRVKSGIRRRDGEQVAIKFIYGHLPLIHLPEISKPIFEEARLMLKVQTEKTSENIIKLYDWFHTEENSILIMEYDPCAITLMDYIENTCYLTDELAKGIMRQLIEALHHCMLCDVHHNDTHRSNILINPDTKLIKLIDFGVAVQIKEGGTDENTVSREVAVSRAIHFLSGTLLALRRKLRGVSEECKDLHCKLKENDDTRFVDTLEAILDHAWFQTV